MENWSGSRIKCNPVVLGQVCSQWRTIVYQSPRLWESILIQTVSLRNVGREDKAQRAISRISQYKTFGIQANQSIFVETWDPRGTEILLSLLGHHRTPWKSIEIIVGSNAPGQWDIEALRATTVKLYRVKQQPVLGFFEPLLRHATSLSITGMPAWGSDPWTSLISLEIRPWIPRGGGTEGVLPFESEHLVQLLNSAPNLEELVLSFPTADESFHAHEETGQTLVHGSIKSLSVHLHHLEHDFSLFGVRVAGPSLRSLAVLSFDRYCDCPSENDISIGWNQLTSLSLGNIADRNQALWAVHFLRRLPTIETLEVQGSNVNELFTLVHPSFQEPPHQHAQLPLPRLTKIIMRETDILGHTLIELLSGRLARLEGDTEGLRAVTDIDLFENSGVLPQDWTRIKILLETGRSNNASRIGGVAWG